MATSFSVQKNARNEAIALQAKAKALREQQRTRIDGRHKYMLGLVADRLDLDTSAVEDFMLDGDQVSCMHAWYVRRVGVNTSSFRSLIYLTTFSRLMEGEQSYSTIKRQTLLSQVSV